MGVAAAGLSGPAIENPTPPRDRRVGERQLSVLRVARLVAGEVDALCLIRNISTGGMMIECFHPLAPGDRVTIELKSDRQLGATVRWVDAHHAGVSFDAPVEISKLLAHQDSSVRFGRGRSPRFERSASVRLLVNHRRLVGEVRNISLYGLCVAVHPVDLLHVDELVEVSLEGFDRLEGAVRWIGPGLVGLMFTRPLTYRQLQPWLQTH
jgi:small nuclear ribonucleoprotein (snRNP)-like protein